MAMSLSQITHDTNPFLRCEGSGCTSQSSATKSLCVNCASIYCESCWDKQGPHQPGKTGPDGLAHERTDFETYDRLRRILDPPESISELTRLHQEDESTAWFGMEKDSSGKAIFQDYGRFAALMADTKQPNSGVRYPQLVSFVGETGELNPSVHVQDFK